MTAIDPFSRNEFAQTVSITQSMFDNHVFNHSFVQTTPKLWASAGAMNDALANFDQQIDASIFEYSTNRRAKV